MLSSPQGMKSSWKTCAEVRAGHVLEAGSRCQVVSSFSSPSTPKSFSAGLLLIPSSPACTDTGDCPNPGAGPCTSPCWTSWSSHAPTSQACPGPSGWHPVPQACRPHHTAWCHLQTCWGSTRSHYVIDEDMKQYWSQNGPLRDTTCHWSPDIEPLTTTLQPIPYPPNSPPIKYVSLQLESRMLWGTVSKALQKPGWMTSVALPLSTEFILQTHKPQQQVPYKSLIWGSGWDLLLVIIF